MKGQRKLECWLDEHLRFTGKTSDQHKCSRIALAEAYVDKRVAGKKGSTKYQYCPTSADEKSNAPWDGLVDFEGANSSIASTWFGLRHARLKSCSPSTYSGFEIWVLRFRGVGASFSSLGCSVLRFECSVLEIWVLHASVFVFKCFVFETTKTKEVHYLTVQL